MTSLQKAQTSDDGVDESRKVRVTVLASEWGSSKGGLSTINRELAIQLAKYPEVEITFFLPQCSQEERKVAHQKYNVNIVEAKPRSGYEQLDWLCFPPEDLQIDIVVGHGIKLGRQANVIKDLRKCKWIQVVHTDPEELGMFKSYSSPISKGEEKHKTEVELCQNADLVVGVGPKLSEAFRSYLRSCQKDESVLDFTPGVFEEFKTLQQVPSDRQQRSVLLFGRGDAEDFELKGFDIAAKAVAALQDTRVVFVGAPDGKHEEIAGRFTGCGVPASRLRVRGFVQDRQSLKCLFQEVDLVVMPSRTEGFGLTGLEALSAGLPVLVSRNSGFGEALCQVPFGSTFVINSEDPTDWTAAIKECWAKDRKLRLMEAEHLRESYDRTYNWAEQIKHLVEKITSWPYARLQIRIDCEEMVDLCSHGGATRMQAQSVIQETARVSGPSNQPPTVDTAGVQEEATVPVVPQEVVQRAGVESGTLETPQMDATSGAANTSQELLTSIASKMFKDLNPSTPDEFNGFIVYLERVRKAVILDVATGSLIVTVECSSLKILEELWEDYNTGYLNEMAQKFLVTEDVLKEFGLAEVKLATTINEEEYRACRELLLKFTDDPSNTQSFSETALNFFPSAFKAFEWTEGVTEENEEKVRDLHQESVQPASRERQDLAAPSWQQGGDETLQRQLSETRLREENVQKQLRETRQRDENLQRQLTEMQQREGDSRRQLQQREDNSQKQLREFRQREENLQRQLTDMQRQEENLQTQLTETQQRKEDLLGKLSEMQQREENSEKQLREVKQREENLQRQLANYKNQVSELQLSISAAQLTISGLRNQKTCDWVISRDEIQMTESCLGRGVWGSVYEGVYCGCTVAVKQIRDLILSPHNIRLFEREMNIAFKCRHPHLLQFIGATSDEGNPLFVTELMEKSLRTLLAERQLTAIEICTISLDVALALSYLHQKKPQPIIHRDVSSANVLLWRQGDQWRAKVSYYGIANFMQQIMTAVPGAVNYGAPEAFTSNQTVKVDVYSFGVLLCEMCIRQLPDPRRRDEQVMLVTNSELRGLVRRCLQRDHWTRPTMQGIIDELKDFNPMSYSYNQRFAK